MRRLLSAGIVVASALTFVGLLCVDGLAGSAKEAKTYEFVAPLDVVMEVADDLFVTLPEKAEAGKFKKVRKEALFLAEISNLYRYAEYDEVDSPEKHTKWNAWVKECVDDFLAIAEASKKKDAAGIKKLHEKIEETCEACHEKF